jgi:uncharacterized protein (DUF1800 family)
MISVMVSQNRSDVALLYRRAGFGLRSDELDRLSAGTYEAAVDGLIAGLGGAADPGSAHLPEPTLTLPARPKKGDLAALKAFNKAITADMQSLQAWWMEKMITTSTPLRERLTLFWHGHFATAVSKVRYPKLMYLQNQLFRTAGAGSFETLMQAVAKDGAMMIWLDTITDKKAHPNENFGREMMELFTLGLGNYTQDDVVAGAEGFTGWTYNTTADRYVFQRAQHDYATKTYLGQTGDWNGNDIVSIAVTRPASPRFVLSKLWSHFAYPVSPAEQVVSDLVDAYGSGMSVSSALRAIFLHPDFRSDTTRTGLVKQPVEYLVGAARTLGLDSTLRPLSTSGSANGTAGGRAAKLGTAGASTKLKPIGLAALATTLGQTLFDPPNVGGWGQNTYWLDTVTALKRFEIALILAERGDITPVSSVPASERVDAAASFLGVDGWGPTTASALAQVADRPSELIALALSSPEYVIA